MLVFALCLTLLTPTADADAAVTTLAGVKTDGLVVALTADAVEVKNAKGNYKISVRDLAKIRFGSPAKSAGPETTVELADGSVLAAREIKLSATGGTVITLSDGGNVTCQRRVLRSVRFTAKESPPEAQWKAAVTSGGQGDMLVVRKTTKNDAGVAEVFLDPLEGAVLEITPDTVKFDFDGDKLDVKREKLEGIVFFKPTVPKDAAVFCKVTRGGTTLAASAVEIGSQLTVTTLSGVKATLPLDGAALDFASGNVAYLSALEPDDVETRFSLQPRGMKTDFSKILGPRKSGPFGSRGAKLGKETFLESGLTLHSNTKLIYRVPDGFRSFSAVVGLAEEASRGADLHLRVLADQRVLFERTLNSDERGPLKIESDLEGAKRITILVEPSSGSDFGDILILGDARFVK